jgi:hypothetical protein
MRKPLVSFLFVALALIGTSGCIFSPDKDDPKPEPPAPIPGNDTPENTMRRFMATYEQKKGIEYEGLFTNDFTFEFSNAVDPTLAAQYASGWFKEDERISAQNLFQGFTNGSGLFVPAATSIDINLAPVAPQPDPTAPDLIRYYQLQSEVDATIVVPPGTGQTEETTYLVDNNVHRFFLIRGDAAAGNLAPEQPADSLHWYIYRWRDETVSTAAAGDLRLASSAPRQTATTLGRVKASTR